MKFNKKTLSLILVVLMLGMIFVSCASNTEAVYGCEDRFVGAWKNDEYAYLFLSNGKYIISTVDDGWEWEEWYIAGTGEWFSQDGNTLVLGKAYVIEYKFDGDNTVILNDGDVSEKFTRTNEHFINFIGEQ